MRITIETDDERGRGGSLIQTSTEPGRVESVDAGAPPKSMTQLPPGLYAGISQVVAMLRVAISRYTTVQLIVSSRRVLMLKGCRTAYNHVLAAASDEPFATLNVAGFSGFHVIRE
jgi:hypothetical protein